MVIKSLELSNFRNYSLLNLSFDRGTNILYGDNAQGKTNILEAIYLCATTKSHKGAKDKDIVNFNEEEAHIRAYLEKKKTKSASTCTFGKTNPRALRLTGPASKSGGASGHYERGIFSPEDLSIIKNGPAERRHFVDMELCQLDAGYLYNLNHYNRIVNQRNRLLKDIYQNPSLRDTLSVWDDQMAAFGSQVIERRITFTEQLNDIIGEIHSRLSGGREHLKVVYEPDVTSENFAEALHRNQERDIRLKMTSTGPHRDDFHSWQTAWISVNSDPRDSRGRRRCP